MHKFHQVYVPLYTGTANIHNLVFAVLADMQGIFCFMRIQKFIREGGGVEMVLTTNTLQDKLINGKNMKKILDSETDAFAETPLPEYLQGLCRERGLLPEQVIRKAQIDRTYGHQFFNGRRNPSRDKLIQLAVGGRLLSTAQTHEKILGGILNLVDSNWFYGIWEGAWKMMWKNISHTCIIRSGTANK